MKVSIALVFLIVFGGFGFIFGLVYRRLCYWKRAGIYVENDEYRVGFFALALILTLYTIRSAQTLLVYHETLREGIWPLLWSILFAYGTVVGFSRKIRSKSFPEMEMPQDTLVPPITGMPDE